MSLELNPLAPCWDLGSLAVMKEDAEVAPRLDPRAAARDRNWPRIPGYEIVAELGRGGMGVVYRGHPSSRLREVAIKVMRRGGPHGAEADALRRFQREARA